MKCSLNSYEDDVLRIEWDCDNNRWNIQIKGYKGPDSVKESMNIFKSINSYVNEIE